MGRLPCPRPLPVLCGSVHHANAIETVPSHVQLRGGALSGDDVLESLVFQSNATRHTAAFCFHICATVSLSQLTHLVVFCVFIYLFACLLICALFI